VGWIGRSAVFWGPIAEVRESPLGRLECGSELAGAVVKIVVAVVEIVVKSSDWCGTNDQDVPKYWSVRYHFHLMCCLVVMVGCWRGQS